MKIHILTYFNKIFFVLNKYYFAKFSTKLNRVVNIISIRYDTLIIIEPFKIDNKYSTISPIWKRYLAIHSPNTKLIVMGFCNFQSRNYIDLLNLPEDFEAYVENALPVSEDWEIPIDGADLLDNLKRFFEGHGGNSLISKLSQLKQSVNIVHTQLISKENSFEELWKELLLPYAKPEFQEFINRWENYYPYFEYLPLYPQIKILDNKRDQISKFFSTEKPNEDLFFNLKINKLIINIYDNLINIDRLYIRPEIY